MSTTIEQVTHLMDTKVGKNIINIARFTFNVGIIYFIWITAHFVSVHLYSTMCVPLTLYGFIISPFMVPAPHCYSLRWLINNGSDQIIAMWSLIGGYLMMKISNLTKHNDKKNN
jgi:hypothetical protein